jgi:tRNA (cmo5U34)-methyltransferase
MCIVVEQGDWDPDSYLEEIVLEIPAYAELQAQTAAVTAGVEACEILELGIGTGETARRILGRHPGAHLTAIDSSPEMLEHARRAFPDSDLRLSRLEDPLPPGPFDLVVSTLCVHHLDADAKRDLFCRIAHILRAGGHFVLADIVVPERKEDVVAPIDWIMDRPDSLSDQLEWLRDAGFEANATWKFKDLAVISSTRGQ